MISYDNLIKKHYILQLKRIDPFKATSPFHPFKGFGLECGEGWYDLLDELCTKIEEELDRTNDSKNEYPFQIDQIKEKFGGLRFYVSGGTDKTYDLINEYEEKSYTICEICGSNGKEYDVRGWITTLCEKCVLPQLMKWKLDVISSIEKCEKEIKNLVVKDILTNSEQKELNEATEWLEIGKSNLEKINKQLNNEVAE